MIDIKVILYYIRQQNTIANIPEFDNKNNYKYKCTFKF